VFKNRASSKPMFHNYQGSFYTRCLCYQK